MLFWALCTVSYSGTVVLSCQVMNKIQPGCGEVLLITGVRLGSAVLLAREITESQMMTASPVTLEVLGLFLRFLDQIDLCT